MKYRAFLAATAIVVSSFNPVLVTPAFAYTIDPADQYCLDQLSPADAAEFQTEAVGVSDSGWVDDGDPYFDPSSSTGPAGDPEGYGTPVAGPITFDGTYYRNGSSPNVWGGGHATLTYPQTSQPWHLLVDQTQTIDFGCHTWKYVGPPDNPENLVEPPGLQLVGQEIVNHQTVGAGIDDKITDADFIVPGEEVVTLICISPNNATKSKPGTWTAKHGFTGSCTTASTLAGNLPIPSGNAPTSDADTTYFPH